MSARTSASCDGQQSLALSRPQRPPSRAGRGAPGVGGPGSPCAAGGREPVGELASAPCRVALRCSDYHRKQDVLRALRKKALDKNPDEFYFKMTRVKLEVGARSAPTEEFSF